MTDAETFDINERRRQRVAHLRNVIALAEAKINELSVPYSPTIESGSVNDVREARLTVLKWAKDHRGSEPSELAEEGDFAKELLRRLQDEWPKDSKGDRHIKFGEVAYTSHDALMDILWALTAEIALEDLEECEWALGCAGSELFEEAYTLGWNQGYVCLQEENAAAKSF